jgi:hypothetical protein
VLEQKLDLNRAEPISGVAGAPSVPMTRIWRTIRGYILWSYERGTIQYDVMVTLILIFVFLSPYWINFRDKPVQPNPHPTDVVVTSDQRTGGFIYQIQAMAVSAKDDAAVREQLLRIIEPIAGEVTITKYDIERDSLGRAQRYKVWVQR